MPYRRLRRAVLAGEFAALVLPAPPIARRLYELDGVRSVIDGAAIATRGAAIVEVDHGHVVASMTRREAR